MITKRKNLTCVYRLTDSHLTPPPQGWVTLELAKWYNPQSVILNICPTRSILSPELPFTSMTNYFLSPPQMSHLYPLDPLPNSWPLTIVANKNARNSHVSIDWLIDVYHHPNKDESPGLSEILLSECNPQDFNTNPATNSPEACIYTL